MKQVLLHIGFHKTGTSSLQEALDGHRDALRQAGLWYPPSTLGFPAQQECAWCVNEHPKPYMRTDLDADLIFGKLRRDFEASGCPTMLLSSEDFATIEEHPSSLEQLKNQLRGYTLKIVVYVREPVDFLLSLYSHRLRQGDLDLTFMDFLHEHMSLRVARYALRLGRWERAFGRENLIVRKYDPAHFTGGSITTDFLTTIGYPEVNIPVMEGINQGVHPWLHQLYRAVAGNIHDPGHRAEIHRQLFEMSRGFPRVAARDFLLSDEDRAFFVETYARSNSTIKELYGIDFD